MSFVRGRGPRIVLVAGALAAWLCAPAHGQVPPRELLLAVVGDAGETGAQLDQVASAARRRYQAAPPTALVFLGDNFYPTGLRGPEQAQKVLRDPWGSLLAALGRARVHAVPGNHDYYKGVFGLPVPFFGLRKSGVEQERALTEWTFHAGQPEEALLEAATFKVQIVFVDSQRFQRDEETSAMEAGLKTVLAARAADPAVRWRALAMHHPVYSHGEHGNGAPAYRDALQRAIHASGARVQFVLAGHDHDLQLIDSGPAPACDGCPRVHLLSGAGSKLRAVRRSSPPCAFSAAAGGAAAEPAAESLPGFAELRFAEERASIAFVGARDGAELAMGRASSQPFQVDPRGSLLDAHGQPGQCTTPR